MNNPGGKEEEVYSGLKSGAAFAPSDSKGFTGRVGLVVHDDTVCGLVVASARQIVQQPGDGTFCVDGRPVAHSSGNRFPMVIIEDGVPAHNLIDFVCLFEDIMISSAQPATPEISGSQSKTNLADYHGELVYIHLSENDTIQAKLTTSSARFRLTVKRNQPLILFTEAIELESLDGRPVSKRGQAGSLVTSKAGKALGIIVCGFDDVSYAAPVAPALDKVLIDWRIPTPAELIGMKPKQLPSEPVAPVPLSTDSDIRSDITRRVNMTTNDDPWEVKRHGDDIGYLLGVDS